MALSLGASSKASLISAAKDQSVVSQTFRVRSSLFLNFSIAFVAASDD